MLLILHFPCHPPSALDLLSPLLISNFIFYPSDNIANKRQQLWLLSKSLSECWQFMNDGTVGEIRLRLDKAKTQIIINAWQLLLTCFIKTHAHLAPGFMFVFRVWRKKGLLDVAAKKVRRVTGWHFKVKFNAIFSSLRLSTFQKQTAKMPQHSSIWKFSHNTESLCRNYILSISWQRILLFGLASGYGWVSINLNPNHYDGSTYPEYLSGTKQ